MKALISVIIPIYNEEKDLKNCLTSLAKQTYKPLEIILVDDGSLDNSSNIAKKFKAILLKQNHKGPGTARNYGTSKAKGEILVFVDADMSFEKNFIRDLVKPIIDGKTIGTFSKNEMNANQNNVWSVCWNVNRGWPFDRLIPHDYPTESPVFRAILKKEFDSVNGFDTTGEYIDDWSLSKKLGNKSTLAPGAVYYHSNPSSIFEVWKQARWIGRNSLLTGSLLRKIKSLAVYNIVNSTLVGLFKSFIHSKSRFLVFKIVYDLAIFLSVAQSFISDKRSK